ncbi:MAG: hypothetical protein LBP23_04760 [Treponema sp.]|jgi:hypothetical protein|nr:hypothetical protein [Treponema sp.]
MPSQILHTLFGEDVIAELYGRIDRRFFPAAEKALQRITVHYRGAFVLGCQGPDIFYHNQRTRPVALEYGSLLHRRGYGVFTAALLKAGLSDPPPDGEYIRAGRREKGINALGVYALGFMTHAVLDRHCHPYIVYKSSPAGAEEDAGTAAGGKGPGIDPGRAAGEGPETGLGRFAHPFFERILDVLMLKRLRGKEISAWDQGILAETCDNPPLGLRELLVRSLTAAFPERAGKDTKLSRRIDNAFLDAARFYRITAPDYPAVPLGGAAAPAGTDGQDGADNPETVDLPFLACLHPGKLPSGIDFLNLRHDAWHYPAEPFTEDRRSFPEIYAGALQGAVDSLLPCIDEYLTTGLFPVKEAARRIGNTGLSVTDGEGRPCAPRRTGPLPLGEVLEEQARLRMRRASQGLTGK